MAKTGEFLSSIKIREGRVQKFGAFAAAWEEFLPSGRGSDWDKDLPEVTNVGVVVIFIWFLLYVVAILPFRLQD